MTNAITKTKKDINDKALQKAFQSEKNRDASAGIRGFIFQNLAAIDELLNINTEYICCEYIEDVTVVRTDGECLAIQAKYYPSGLSKKMRNEIIRELFFQYKKLKIANYQNTITPVLLYFDDKYKLTKNKGYDPVKDKKAFDEAWDAIGINPNPPVTIQTLDELETKIDPATNKKYTKEAKEQLFFDSFATKADFEECYKEYEIHEGVELDRYRKQLQSKLLKDGGIKVDGSPLQKLDKKERGEILLGIALELIEQTFERMKTLKTDANIQRFKKITRDSFIAYLNQTIQLSSDKTNQLIIEYMNAVCTKAAQRCDLKQPDKKVKAFLIEAEAKTKKLLKKELVNEKKQFALLATVTKENIYDLDLEDYLNYNYDSRIRLFAEHSERIESLFSYLWKMMYQLGIEDVDKCLLFENNYVKLNIPNDIGNHSILMGFLSTVMSETEFGNRLERVKEWNPLPDKWYLKCEYNGLKSYNQDVSRMPSGGLKSEEWKNIDLIGPDQFLLECMACVDVEADWENGDNYMNYVLSKDCRG